MLEQFTLPTVVNIRFKTVPVTYLPVESLDDDGNIGAFTAPPSAIWIAAGERLHAVDMLSTLVHECAHAWLHSAGYYAEDGKLKMTEEQFVRMFESACMDIMLDNPELVDAFRLLQEELEIEMEEDEEVPHAEQSQERSQEYH